MSFIDYSNKEIVIKIVYYGPAFSGKATNLRYLYEKTAPDAKGKLISLARDEGNSLFFDFVPADLGRIRGFKTRFSVHTMTGEVADPSNWKVVLKGVDGIVFVADSHTERMAANQASLGKLRTKLAEIALSVDTIPLVMQFNKRDLPGIASVEEMTSLLTPGPAPTFQGIAQTGAGVFDSFKAISRLTQKAIQVG